MFRTRFFLTPIILKIIFQSFFFPISMYVWNTIFSVFKNLGKNFFFIFWNAILTNALNPFFQQK